jgi:hypothetical protein
MIVLPLLTVIKHIYFILICWHIKCLYENRRYIMQNFYHLIY